MTAAAAAPPTPPYGIRCKTSAECGYVRPDPAELLRRIRIEVGLAEGHMANVDALHRQLQGLLDDDQ